MLRPNLLSLASACALAAVIQAQPYPDPVLSLAASPRAPSLLYRLELSGRTSTLVSFPLVFVPNSFTHHHDNRTLAIHSTNPDGVVLLDPTTGIVLSVLHEGAPFGNIASVRPYHTGDYLVADTGSEGTFVRVVRADGGGLRTAFGLRSVENRISVVAQDLFTGEILAGLLHVGPTPGPSLIRIEPESGAFTVLDPTPRQVTSLVQDHRDGAILYGEYHGGIFRRAPHGAIAPLLDANHPSGVTGGSLAFDRAEGHGILVAGGNGRIARIAFAPGGRATVIAVHSNTGTLPPMPAVAVDLGFEQERNVVSRRTGTGNRWSFELSFPLEGGRRYVLLLSAAGFTPGLDVGDGRRLPLVPDGLLVLSASGGLAPFLQNNVGVLDGVGRATATLDLGSVGVRLSGVRLWLAAATLDPGAPGAVATIGKPAIIVLD